MIEVTVQIDQLRSRLNELSSHGASYSEILSASERLDEAIVKYHKKTADF